MVDLDETSLLVIGTFMIAIGTVIGLSLSIIIQKKESRLHTALEILKMLGTERSRKSRILVYEAYGIYKKDKNLSIFDAKISDKDFQMATGSLKLDFDLVGTILHKRHEFLDDFLDAWLHPTITCYKCLKDNIEDERKKFNYKDHMKHFEWLYKRAENEWEKRYPGIPSPEPGVV
jgi:hypothetical protein